MPRKMPQALRGPFSQFRYEPPPGDLDGFPGVFEGGGSRKRKSVPTKMPYTHPSDEAALALHPEDSKLHGHPNFPLLFAQPPRPQYDSQMIDLCNVGFQFYRTLEHLGGKRVKQEPVKPSAVWPQPAPAPFLPTPYPYYPKVPPGLVFPFFVPAASPFPFSRHTFLPKQPPDPRLPRKAEPPESEEAKQKVERMDVNVQIDDSYYVDVGGAQKRWQCPTCEKSHTFPPVLPCPQPSSAGQSGKRHRNTSNWEFAISELSESFSENHANLTPLGSSLLTVMATLA